MAKTIMIAADVYEELKLIKYNNSFSEIIRNLLHSTKSKKVSNLYSCFGIMKEDLEGKAINRVLKKGWKNWNKKYV